MCVCWHRSESVEDRMEDGAEGMSEVCLLTG